MQPTEQTRLACQIATQDLIAATLSSFCCAALWPNLQITTPDENANCIAWLDSGPERNFMLRMRPRAMMVENIREHHDPIASEDCVVADAGLISTRPNTKMVAGGVSLSTEKQALIELTLAHRSEFWLNEFHLPTKQTFAYREKESLSMSCLKRGRLQWPSGEIIRSRQRPSAVHAPHCEND
jgi:hypothetical protein